MALDAPVSKNHMSLFSVPPEIRNVIYELVVAMEWGHTSQDFFVLDRPLPALFRVSRQVRSEALDVFLLKNRFHVYTSSIGLKWLDILGRDVDRLRFMILFIDLNLEAWQRYLKALLPLVSVYLELRIRKAAVSLPDYRLETFLKASGLYDADCWASEANGPNETIFRRIRF
ncbi:hypothetical protein F5Y14DRAFT_66908 [Nemania sp. NC0429]|nr:hypothetical protein F5Y14DRAFT_66908 [Nemania sp. NC0429]